MDSVGEISGLVISGLRKKLADSSSAYPLILEFILTNLHLKYSNSYILVYYKYLCFFIFKNALADSRLADSKKNLRCPPLILVHGKHLLCST
jgi:hypothetical protein